MGKKDLVITDCETQRDMKRLAGARSICLDAYGTDSDGKKYDLEIQKAEAGQFTRLSVSTLQQGISLRMENISCT